MRKPGGQAVFLGTVIVGVIVLFAYLLIFHDNGQAGNQRGNRPSQTLAEIPFDGTQAYQYLKDICALGPRISGSEGMLRQQEMLTEHFSQLGGRVSKQQFDVRHPVDGSRVTMTNLVVEWHPQRKERILLCAHYDTRPYPDEDPDPRRRRGTFIGANDGASGVAVLCELARHMPKLSSRYGVDFVLFDGEELVYDRQRDPYFLGSTHFAQKYRSEPPGHVYRMGILLDMVGDADLQIYQERNSLRHARSLVRDVWSTAQRLGVREFILRSRHEIRDDHLPLNTIARVPTCDIIDFDYPRPGSRTQYWHTEADTPDKCSPLSLAKVGWVVHEWLKRVR